MHAQYIQYTELEKTRQYVRVLAKLKTITDIQKNWIELTTATHPPTHFFFKLISDMDRKLDTCSGGRRVKCNLETLF